MNLVKGIEEKLQLDQNSALSMSGAPAPPVTTLGPSGLGSRMLPSPRRFVNPDDPVCVLLVGPSQNGKTTLVNRLIDMAVNEVERGREGDKNGKCTVTTAEYDLEVPTSGYVLVDKSTGLDVNEVASDEGMLMSKWRKMRSTGYEIKMVDQDPVYLKLHLIDTPGLDDSEGKDYENMEDVLSTLHRLQTDDMPWKRKLNAVVLVYNANNPFSQSFQTIVKSYHQCMPNLFGTMAVVNTHFDMASLGQRRLHLLREGIITSQDSARRAVMDARQKDFKKLIDLPLSPQHFHVDNRPGDRNAFADILSRNTIADLIKYLAASRTSPMPITRMRVAKSPEMEAVDGTLQRLLSHAISEWSKELSNARERASDIQAFRSLLLQQHGQLQNSIARCREDLERYDNDSRYDLRTYVTDHNPGAGFLFFCGTILRIPVKEPMTIAEEGYENDEFWVEALDGDSGRWLRHEWMENPRKWVGQYEGTPGQAPRLLAKTWTTNRVKHKDIVAKKRAELRELEADLVQNEAMWKARGMERAPGDGSARTELERKLDNLVGWVEAAKNLKEILGQKTSPIDSGFNEVARKRYRKLPDQIRAEDLYEFVAAAKLEVDLLGPLREAGLEGVKL